MTRTIRLALSNFASTPQSLRVAPNSSNPADVIRFNVANLYHHYHLDTYDAAPPDPNPANFEYLRFLAPSRDFRWRGDGLGFGSAARRHRSNEIGQAFCRLFLHDYLGIQFFAHMEHVLNRNAQDPFSAYRIDRTDDGDTPDYFCASAAGEVYLAEAKGRYESVSFASKKFEKWRQQFCRVAVRRSTGEALKVKGFIVATRYATETQPRLFSRLFAEDPETLGDGYLNEDRDLNVAADIISIHYAGIAEKLNQPVLASALFNGFALPEAIQVQAFVWEFQVPPLQKLRFVGGFFPARDGWPTIVWHEGKPHFHTDVPFRLDVGRGVFFGVEEGTFRKIVASARRDGGIRFSPTIPIEQPFEDLRGLHSSASFLRDGTLLCPVDFLRPVDFIIV